MLRIFLPLLLLLSSFALSAQSTEIAEWERKAQEAAHSMLHSRTLAARDSSQTKLKEYLVAIFKSPEAFRYEFPALRSVSCLLAPDRAFRLFTWQLFVDDRTYRYGGYVLLPNGKFFELNDAAKDMRSPENLATGPDRWYGALYYNILPFEHNGKMAYALLGYNAHSFFSRRKIFEVMTFSLSNKPLFGAPVIEAKYADGKKRLVKRYLMEYSAEVAVRLNWDKELGMIVFDHLILNGSSPDGPLNFPDGSYSAFKLHKGRWTYVDKLFEEVPVLEDGQAPVPHPKNDAEGLFGPK
jgi:hypothetical protein